MPRDVVRVAAPDEFGKKPATPIHHFPPKSKKCIRGFQTQVSSKQKDE
jgi:hypothetical protein